MTLKLLFIFIAHNYIRLLFLFDGTIYFFSRPMYATSFLSHISFKHAYAYKHYTSCFLFNIGYSSVDDIGAIFKEKNSHQIEFIGAANYTEAN